MKEFQVYNLILICWFALSACVFVLLLFMSAPYGRHARKGWGAAIGARAGWVLMEIPTVIVMLLLFLIGSKTRSPVAIFFLLMWQFHYVYRCLIFPALLPKGVKAVPLVIIASGFTFNILNSYLNGRYLFSFSSGYNPQWFGDPRFCIGLVMFCLGFYFHSTSDGILRRLRASRQSGYSIPYGGLYNLISCPNYFGEMLQWAGWAVATWSVPGLAFFVWTTANLLPRAISHHKWYRREFPDYPENRKAVIPFVL